MEACQMRGLLYERHKHNDKRQNWIFKNGLNISYNLFFFPYKTNYFFVFSPYK